MIFHKQAFILASLILFPFWLLAHGYWMDIQGNGKINSAIKIEICYGEIDDHNNRVREAGDDLKYTGEFRLFVLEPNGKKVQLRLHPAKDSWYAQYTPTQKGTYKFIGQNDSLPVVDRSKTGGKNILPIEYLYGLYCIGEKPDDKINSLYLDLLISKDKDMITVRPMRDGISVSNTKLRVFNPQNWEKTLDVDAEGITHFYPNIKGKYFIRMDWYDDKKGELNGIKYTSIRHRCNYCIEID